MEKRRLTYLLERYTSNVADAAERRELFDYLHSGQDKELFTELVFMSMQQQNDPSFDTSPYLDLARQAVTIDNKIFDLPTDLPAGRAHHRLSFLRKWGWAAAVVLLVIAGAITYRRYATVGEIPAKNHPVGVNNDVAAGSDKAILTLADGSTIVLDSAANGKIARQNNAEIIKDDDGNITYKQVGSNDLPVVFNTMRTPKGGKYKLILPDGSGVWLNAASSVTFPATFTGKERTVKVSGEVYLEVVKDVERPFIVDVNGKESVEVLGTSFNINSYEDEEGIRTTLLQGSVRVLIADKSAGRPSQNGSVILHPGYQAVVMASEKQPKSTAGNIEILHSVDVDQVLAWKNDVFNFTNLDVPAVFRQIARWYDVDVRFIGQPPVKQLRGKMSRNLSLSEVLELLGELNLQFTLEGKILTVKAK